MANWSVLKAAIADVIKTNGNQEITGQLLQNTLNNIVNAVGENATFVGIATTATSPGTPDGPVFYIASTAGDYPNFGGINLAVGEIAVLHFSNGSWAKRLTNAVSKSRFLSSLALSKGYYFDASRTPKGQLTSYKFSKLTPFLYIPTSPCTFKYIWGAANVGSSFVYFDKDFKYVGETHQASAISYDYDPSTEEIPEGAVYMIVQFQDEAFEILTSELINTGILYKNAADIQQNIVELKELKALPSAGVYNLHGCITTSGQFSPLEDYRATDFIPLSNSAPIKISNAEAGPNSLIIAFYDENKTFISGINNATSANISVEDIPKNAKYIRCGTSLATAETATVINISVAELGIKVTKLESKVTELESKVAELGTEVAEIKNANLKLDIEGYYGLNGIFVETSNARTTGLISIADYTELEYQVKIATHAAAVSFYDKDRTCISSLSIPGAGDELAFGVVDLTESKYDNVKYIALSYYSSNADYSQYKGILSNKNSLESRITELESKDSASILLPSKDDKLSILIFGDSITDCASITIDSVTNTTTAYSLLHPANSYTNNKGQLIRFDMWPYLITQYLNCFDLRNYAQSGASYKYSERETENLKRQNLSYQIEVAINDLNNPNGVFPTEGQFSPDIIIFALGTNDGSPNDTFDTAMSKTIMDTSGKAFDIEATLANLDLSKFCEAVRYAFLTIKKQFPYALCMCVLPIQKANSDVQQTGVNSELKKMAERYSIKVIDGASEMGIVRDLETDGELGTSLKDGLHPNEKGQNLYARLIINAIKNNWLKLNLMNEM